MEQRQSSGLNTITSHVPLTPDKSFRLSKIVYKYFRGCFIDTELGVGGAQKRYWKRISTVLLVIVIACSLIALVVFISTPRAGSILSLRKILKKWLLEDSDTMTTTTKGSQTPATTTATARRFASARSSASNVRFSGKDTILFDDDGDLWRLSLHNMETRPLFRSFYTQIWANRGLDEHCPASAKRSTKICSDYKILSTHWHHGASPDLRFSALLKATSRKVHRKFNATYTFSIVNLEELSRITQEKVMNSSKKMPKRLVYKVGIKKTAKEAQRIFKWNSVGDDYIFWQDGHLYYSDTAESTTSIQISGGGPNWEHGIFDWVYEEEIFGRGSKAVWWSVKGQKLAFLSREKTKEKSVYLTSYYRHEKYPIVVELPYPKTHEERLPTYTINLWDKKTHELKRMDVQLRDSTIFHYLYGVKWIVMNDEELLVATWANRLQTHISVTICGHTAGICKLIFEHQYPSKTWAEPSDFASLLGTDDAIYMLLPRATADGNSYQHIAKLMIQMESSRSIKGLNWANMSFLSLGNFDVVNIESYDKGTDTMELMKNL
ncbi:hypothetical protein Y032_0246g2 [Ancylostoma ceylanicum]|nr:hypothetical protein Y032_0246g2 [Ancylostoma ceylanicum]